MLKNPKTTLIGILTVLSAIIAVALSFLKGIPINFVEAWALISTGLAGLGLIKSTDGKA